MSRTVLCAALVLCAASNVSAKEWARNMFQGETSHDFGNVARGAKVEYAFVLKNIYKEDVHVSGVRSSCGCTTPKVVKDTLKTYEEGAILATFNTQTFSGARSATLTVTIDKPFYAEVQLQVKGYIRTDIVFEPGSVNLGAVDRGQEAAKKVRISYSGHDKWKIVEARPGSEYIEAAVKEISRAGGQTSYELAVTLKKDAPVGYIKEQLTLITNDRNAKEVPVAIEGRVVSELTVSPPTLYLGSLRSGAKVVKQLVIKGKTPFKILGIRSNDGAFEFSLPEAAKPVHVVPVTYTAGEDVGKQDYKLTIETDLGEDLTQEISCFAQVLPLETKVVEASRTDIESRD